MENFFIPQPELTNVILPGPNGPLPVYTSGPLEMKWSGKEPLPKVGDRVKILINSIGYGTVKGYAASHGYLGLLVQPEAPPDWLKRQTKNNIAETKRAKALGPEKAKLERIREWPEWINQGICCVFGVEVSK